MSDDFRHLRLDPAGGSGPPGDEPDSAPPPHDELDALLREWHQSNADRAAAGRDRLLAALAERETRAAKPNFSITVRRVALRAFIPLAAAAAIALVVLPFLRTSPTTPTIATAVARSAPMTVLAADAGRLEALTSDGQPLGPLELEHTDVQAAITGAFARVTLTQRYRNPHPQPIDAQYTLPIRDGGTIDELQLSIGDRVILGEIVPTEQADSTLAAARERGHVAARIAEDRPTQFTQTVVNLEPAKPIEVRVSYVEPLKREADGDWAFTFPAALTPRYTGSSAATARATPTKPNSWSARDGLVLLAPGVVTTDSGEALPTAEALALAAPINSPAGDALARYSSASARRGRITYPDGQRESVVAYAPDTSGVTIGEVGGRWFALDRDTSAPPAHPQEPVSRRRANDFGLRLHLDTGGLGLLAVESPDFPIVRQDTLLRGDGLPTRCVVSVQPRADAPALPNQDFTLRWRLALPSIPVAAFTEHSELGDFVGLVVSAPNMIDARLILPRELTFIVDPLITGDVRLPTVISAALAQFHPQDTFNLIIARAEDPARHRLWRAARPVNAESITAAENWLRSVDSSTPASDDTFNALHVAQLLADAPRDTPTLPISIADLQRTPADGRTITVRVHDNELDSSGLTPDSVVIDAAIIFADPRDETADGTPLPTRASVVDLRLPRALIRRAAESVGGSEALAMVVTGRWQTVNGQPVLLSERAELADTPPLRAHRVAFALARDPSREQTLRAALAPHLPDSALLSVSLGSDRREPTAIATSMVARLPLPILTDLTITPSPELAGVDFEPAITASPSTLDASTPLVFIGRAAVLDAGSITLTAQSLSGPWTVTLPVTPADTSVNNNPPPPGPLPTLWARARIDRLASQRAQHSTDVASVAILTEQIAAIAAQFGVVTEHTSLIAIDHRRLTIDGHTVLAPVPVERTAEPRWTLLLADHASSGAAAPTTTGAGMATPSSAGVGTLTTRALRKEPVDVAPSEPARLSLAPSASTEVHKAAGARAEAREIHADSAINAETAHDRAAAPAPPLATPAPGAPILDGRDRGQTGRAEAYFNNINATLDSVEDVGITPPDRLAAAAAANFITQSALDGELVVAQRAQELFQGQYPNDPLLTQVGAVLNRSQDDPSHAKRAAARGGGRAAAAKDAPPSDPAAAAQILDVNQLAELAQQALDREAELSRRLDSRLYQRLAQPRAAPRQQFGAARQYQQQQQQWSTRQHPPQDQQQNQQYQQQQLRSYANSSLNRVAIESPEGELIVSVLVERLDDAVLDALRRAGLRVQSTLADSSVIIGVLAPSALEAVAMVEGVKRIEPATVTPP